MFEKKGVSLSEKRAVRIERTAQGEGSECSRRHALDQAQCGSSAGVTGDNRKGIHVGSSDIASVDTASGGSRRAVSRVGDVTGASREDRACLARANCFGFGRGTSLRSSIARNCDGGSCAETSSRHSDARHGG